MSTPSPALSGTTYVGRFAPSPSGPLHFGSLVAAVGSFADALHHGGCWLLRIDDVDETRTIPGMADAILQQLEDFGFTWDRAPVWQSTRKDAYLDIIGQLLDNKQAFHCRCTRRDVLSAGIRGPHGLIYPGTCRRVQPTPGTYRTIRLKTDQTPVGFNDRLAGPLKQNLHEEVGDFVIRRADGYTAYQLAVVIDDHLDAVTQIVRGADLLASTPRQIHLQQLLGYTTPQYGHLPLVLDSAGRKLSKLDGDRPVATQEPLRSLLAAWQFLGQATPKNELCDLADFWAFAAANWSTRTVPAIRHYFDGTETLHPSH